MSDHPLQRRIDGSPRQSLQCKQLAQLQGESAPPRANGLPSPLRAGIEALSGIDMGNVVVHRNSGKPAQLNAHAYAQGNEIHLGPGQEKHLPHEAWHVVQQRQGRVRPTTQLAEMAVNDNAGLEREADAMGERALQAMTDNSMREDQVGLVLGGGVNGGMSCVAQRVLKYGEKQFKSMKELAQDSEAFEAFQGSGVSDKRQKLNDSTRVYDLKDPDLKEVVDEQVEGPSEQELRNANGASKGRETVLEKRIIDYPKDHTLYAPIDKAIVVVNPEIYRFIGTSGLIGCVEVMIECHASGNSGYLVAHVSSDIEDNEEEIRRQLGVMLNGLGREMHEEINWDAFKHDSPTHKLTLVRSAQLGEQRLLINMRNILAESGAEMVLVNSNSASMEVSVHGTRYYDNQRSGVSEIAPRTDYRSEKGYPFPEDN